MLAHLSSHIGRPLLLTLALACSGCAATPGDRWLATDKAQHLALSALTGAVTTRIAEERGSDPCTAFRLGVGIPLGAGALKETYDAQVKETYWSWRDMTANLVGALAGAALASDC